MSIPLLSSLLPCQTLSAVRSGPITVFNKVIFDILKKEANPPDYLHFLGWVYLWGAILHWITAILNCKRLFSPMIMTSLPISNSLTSIQGATF